MIFRSENGSGQHVLIVETRLNAHRHDRDSCSRVERAKPSGFDFPTNGKVGVSISYHVSGRDFPRAFGIRIDH